MPRASQVQPPRSALRTIDGQPSRVRGLRQARECSSGKSRVAPHSDDAREVTAFCPTHAQCNAKVRANGRQQQAADGPFLILMSWRVLLPFFLRVVQEQKRKGKMRPLKSPANIAINIIIKCCFVFVQGGDFLHLLVALRLRSLRFHSPRLCRVAVFLIETNVSLGTSNLRSLFSSSLPLAPMFTF